MKRFSAWMMTGAMALTVAPAAFAQSMSSSSMMSSMSSSSVSSSGITITPATNSSSSLSSAPIYQPSSRSSSSSSLTRAQERLLRNLSSASMESSASSRSVRDRDSMSSMDMDTEMQPYNARMIPEECAGLVGRSLGQCVTRLSPSYVDRSASSSSSSASMTGSTVKTSQDMLHHLFRMSTGNATNLNVMRQLCGFVTGEFVSTCATGASNLRTFNMALNQWFFDLGHALVDMMRELNVEEQDVSDDYFWNNPWYGTGATMTGSTLGDWWDWRGGSMSSWSSMSSSSMSSSN